MFELKEEVKTQRHHIVIFADFEAPLIKFLERNGVSTLDF